MQSESISSTFPKLLTVDEAVRLLRLSEDKAGRQVVYRLCRERKIGEKVGKTWRIVESRLVRMFNESESA